MLTFHNDRFPPMLWRVPALPRSHFSSDGKPPQQTLWKWWQCQDKTGRGPVKEAQREEGEQDRETESKHSVLRNQQAGQVGGANDEAQR